jgi:chromosome segregation ATPase
MSGTVSGVGLTFKAIKTLTIKANEQLQGLVDSAERLEGASNGIAKTADASSTLAHNLERTADTLPALQEGLDKLRDQLGGLNVEVENLEAGIRDLPRPMWNVAKLGIDVSDALENAARVLAAANAESVSLVVNTAEHATALERANAAAADLTGLEEAKVKLESILNSMGNDVLNFQGGLSDATVSLRDAIGASITALEVDVQRSSEVSRLFGERMTDIAQIIIDRTRENRPS